MRFCIIFLWLATLAGSIAVRVEAAFTVERVASGLNQPIHMAQAPGDNDTLYIVERSAPGGQLGRIVAYDQLTGSTSTFLDVSGTVIADGGLLSVTFHPDFQNNQRFYTVSNDNQVNGLDEWQVVDGTPTFQRRLMEYANLDNNFHTMNLALFHPHGDNNHLFLVTGDGGTQANSPNFNQSLIEDPTSPYGKVMRLDLNDPFTSPAADPTAPGIDLVARGLRNPYRSSFDRQTGDMYLADVGFNSVEEVNFIPTSHFTDPQATPLHFGWSDREGTIETIANHAGGPKEPGDIDPVFEYAHHGGVPLAHESALFGGSITGGFVYRGSVPELQGRYFFADFTSQQIYSGVFDRETDPANYNGNNFTDLVRHDQQFEALVPGGAELQFITSFAEDNAGNLYLVKFGDAFFPPLGQGEIFRVAASPFEVVVDRDTGSITLANTTDSDQDIEQIVLRSEFGAIDVGGLTPVTGNYDASGNGLVDDNDPWAIASQTAELFQEATTGDPGTIAAQSQVSLSPAGGWFPSPQEDLAVQVRLAGGSLATATVRYVGNEDQPFMLADLDFDGVLSRADFAILAQNAYRDLNVASLAEAYALGDLTGDGVSNFDDFRLFKQQYVAVHGAEAFAQLLQVPEPDAMLLLAGLTIGLHGVSRRRFSRQRSNTA